MLGIEMNACRIGLGKRRIEGEDNILVRIELRRDAHLNIKRFYSHHAIIRFTLLLQFFLLPRIGQENQVSVFKLITKHTIEENILKLQEMKRDLADTVVTEGTGALSSITREDLIRMLDEDI